jgi:hypothetical protein
MTEAEAFDEEMRLIALHGRADLGLGPLLNLTAKISAARRAHLSAANMATS